MPTEGHSKPIADHLIWNFSTLVALLWLTQGKKAEIRSSVESPGWLPPRGSLTLCQGFSCEVEDPITRSLEFLIQALSSMCSPGSLQILVALKVLLRICKPRQHCNLGSPPVGFPKMVITGHALNINLPGGIKSTAWDPDPKGLWQKLVGRSGWKRGAKKPSPRGRVFSKTTNTLLVCVQLAPFEINFILNSF